MRLSLIRLKFKLSPFHKFFIMKISLARYFFVCMFACLLGNFSKLAKLAKSINLVKFKKLMLLFTRLFVYLQYKNIIIIVTTVVFSNLKGGVGKNTLCCYFAHFLVAKNSVTIQRL